MCGEVENMDSFERKWYEQGLYRVDWENFQDSWHEEYEKRKLEKKKQLRKHAIHHLIGIGVRSVALDRFVPVWRCSSVRRYASPVGGALQSRCRQRQPMSLS